MENVARIIGYAVFSVAKVDRKITEVEKQVVHDFVNENWKLLADKEDPFGVRALDFIDKMMVVLDDKELSSEEAFEVFQEEFKVYKKEFTPEIKSFMLDLCIKTGNSFNRMNKHELVLLSRLENFIKNK